MKRTLSLLLALVLVIGLVPVSFAQAAESNDVVIVDGSTSMSELVEQGIVMQTGASGNEPVTVPAVPTVPQVSGEEIRIPVADQESAQTQSSAGIVCDCGMGEVGLYSHSDGCTLKQYYIQCCSGTVGEVYERWLNATAANREFLEDYLAANYPETLAQLQARQTAELESVEDLYEEPELDEFASERLSGEASAAVDGITVDALGVPEGSELTVQEPSKEALDAVEELVSQVAPDKQLFVYDISVQNEESDNWQPEGSVKLTLTLPGAENLPKYTPVKIVHVDDEGNTSTIDAYVDEGGKVVFETTGFSTFAGFTVDFDYEGVQFSIPGETSVRLSELFENLKMPLDAADVVNVTYTDDTQIKVVKMEADWMLTSLKAFDTEEKLALTMADGTVYNIKVTDAVLGSAYFAYRHEKGVSETSSDDGNGLTRCAWLDSQSTSTKGNAYVRVLLDPGKTDGCPGTGTTGSYTDSEDGTYDGEAGKYENWYWYSQPLIFDGRNQNGTFTISLRRRNKTETANKVYYLDIWHWKIINGAQVILNVGGPNTADGDGFLAGDQIVIRKYYEKYNSSGTVEYAQENMFEVKDGSLTITGTSDVRVYLDGNGNLTDDNNKQIVRLLENTDNFTMDYTTVRNAPAGGVISWATNMQKFSMTSTTFESTVKRNSGDANGNGGAIYLTGQGTSDGFRTVGEFSLNKCTFNGNQGGSQGGAICLMDAVRLVNIKDCTFKNCVAGSQGGAIAFRGAFGKISIKGSDPDGTDTTKLTTFSNCTAKGNGGAICLDTVALRYNSTSANTHYSRTHTLNLDGCQFTSCIADATHSSTTDGLGGAINLTAEINTVSINHCTFDKCQAKGGVTNLAGAGICFGQTNVKETTLKTNENVKVYGGSPGLSGWVPASATTWTESGSTKGADIRSLTLGWERNADGQREDIQRTTIGNVTIQNSTFKNSSNTLQGGAFLVRTGAAMESLTMQNTVVDSCKVIDKGSAIFFNNCIVGTSSFTNCTFRNNEVLQSLYTGGGTIRTTGQTSTVMTIDNCKFLDNKGNLAGGGVYWNAGATKTTPSQYAAGTTPAETKITIKNSEFRRNTAEINENYPDWDRPEGTEEDILYVDANNNPLRKVRFGGGIFCETKMSIESCIFDGNKADKGGGLCMGVYNANYRMFEDNETTQLKLDSGTQFFNNQAKDGGGLAIRANKTLAIQDGDNIHHTVDFTLGGAQIYNNVATNNGGGIYYIAETYENDALGNAEVDNYTKTITIDEGTIYGNSAGKNGGGVYMESNSKTTIRVTDGIVTGDNTEAGHSTVFGNYAGLTRAITFTKTGTDSNGNNVGTTTISNGTVTGGNGGGIYLTSSEAKVYIDGGYFGAYLDANDSPVASGNQAYRKDSDSNTGNGGGIFVRGGTVVSMNGGYIVNNTSGTSGGGIAVHGGSTMQLKDGFVENNVSNMGGGISLNGATGDGGNNVETKYGMYVNGGTVRNNKVQPVTGESRAYGGGICIASSSTMRIDNGNISGNKAVNTDGTTYAANQEGGGIAVCENSELTITGGYIKENHAYDGGGITVRNNCTVHMTGEITLTDGKVTAYKGAIEDNIAQRRGGGIYMPTDGNSSMTMTGGYIYSNECKQTDGKVGSECLGGGIMVRSTNTFTLDGGRIDGNEAFAGGGIYAYNAKKVLIQDGVMSGNIAPRHGGAIYNDYSSVEVTGGEFYGNKATKNAYDGYSGSQGNGGAIFNYGSTSYPFTFKVTGTGGNFHNNEAMQSGGAIYNGGVGTATISGGTFTANTAVEYGGAISNNDCTISITTGTFTRNTAKKGGAIYAIGGTGAVSGGTFDLNTSTTGGALYIDSCTQFNISGGTFTTNTASSNAGGLYATGGQVTVSGGDFSGNSSVTYGGGAYFDATNVTFTDGSFDDNAAKNGGGLCIIDSTVGFTGGTFTNNVADRGGAVFIRSSGVTIEGITVENNSAKADERYGEPEYLRGGGICVDTYGNGPANVTINGGDITGNSAEYGGGLWINNNAKTENKANVATIIINGGNMIGNHADIDGGGVWIGGEGYATETEKTTLTLNGGLIQNNTADGNGGGIWIGKQAYANINGTAQKHGEIDNNQAANGGGIFVINGANLTVTNGYITNNSAVGTPELSSGHYGVAHWTDLVGAGGGICMMNGSSGADSTFTLEGDNVAIYGNQADFSGDDVFSNGYGTQLNVRPVADMNLAGYDFNPEGWFEDYNEGDSYYLNQFALGMIIKNGGVLTQNPDGTYSGVSRYRNASPVLRRFMEIKTKGENGEDYVKGAADVDYTYVNMKNAYVAMTLGIPAAADDTVIIDFGTKVVINAAGNDVFMETGDFKNTIKEGTTTEVHHSYVGKVIPDSVLEKDGVRYSKTKPPTGGDAYGIYQTWFASDMDGEVRNLKNGTITFEVKNTNMSKENVFFYMVEHSGVWYYANVTVIPATTLYYEDNTGFVNYHTTSNTQSLATWELIPALGEGETESKLPGFVQDEDRPGAALLPEMDKDNVYGYDSTYSESETFSNGAAHWVHVSRDEETRKTTNARASFTFTGTGFDIISYCSANTGTVLVNVFKGTVSDFDNPPWDDYVISYMVNTYFQDDGDTFENGLYQVPVIKGGKIERAEWNPDKWDPVREAYGDYDIWYEDFEYGTYTVEIYVAPSYLEREQGYWGADFYLDAIRVYNPAGVGEGVKDTIQNAYKEDGEAWPVYAELRNMFLDQSDLENNEDQVLEGILFVDGLDQPTLGNYRSWGPNNEIYLNPDQSIAFTMNMSAYGQDVAGIHIAMRGLTGKGSVLVQAGSSADSKTTLLDTDLGTTDLYYNIGQKDNSGAFIAAGQVVTITNDGDTPISLSNVKVTHGTKPAGNSRAVQIFEGGGHTGLVALEILGSEALVDPIITPKYPALSFNGMVCYNVFFSAEDLGNLTGAELGLAVFSTKDTEGTVETAQEVIYGAKEINGLYMVETGGVHAKYLGDTRYFRAFAKKADGNYVYSKMVSYSAADYAYNVLGKSDDVALRQLVVAMLNYGTEAQKFFGYKTDDLMNKNLTADHQALVNGFDANSLKTVGKVDASKVGAFASTGGFTKKSPAISFKGAFEINYFFTPAYAVDGDMTLYFWNEDTYNSVTELTAENADKAVTMTLDNGTYSAASDEIAAKYLDRTVYVAAVYESNGVTYCSGVLPYSIAVYCQKPPATVQDLAAAAAIYGCTAKQYFGV